MLAMPAAYQKKFATTMMTTVTVLLTNSWSVLETPCEMGLETCQDGNWICTATQPEEEQCDGADNDCDSQIDED